MKLLDLIRRRRLAYDLLAEYDAEAWPVDPERYKRSMETIRKWAQRGTELGSSTEPPDERARRPSDGAGERLSP